MQQICRTCLQEVQVSQFVSLRDAEKAEEIKQQLKLCVPELSQHMATVMEPVLCIQCVESLKAAYTFKTQCLRTEERIKAYIQNLILKSNIIDLNEVSQQKEDELDVMEVNCVNEPVTVKQEIEEELEREIERVNVTVRGSVRSPIEFEWAEPSSHPAESIHSTTEVDCTEPSLTTQEKVHKCMVTKHFAIPRSNSSCSSSSRSYLSPVREYSCQRKDDLTLHLKRQENEPLYNCPECDYSTITKQGLRKHMILHFGQGPLKASIDNLAKSLVCTVCSFSTKKTSLLVEHLKDHMPDKN